MNLEAFNLLLAVGGAAVVPTVVGVVAANLVRRQDMTIYAEMRRDLLRTAEPRPATTKDAADDHRVPA